jgi:hypothetical protein
MTHTNVEPPPTWSPYGLGRPATFSGGRPPWGYHAPG